MHPQHVGNLVLEFVLEQKKTKKKRKAIFFQCTGEMHNVLIACCLPAKSDSHMKILRCSEKKKKKIPEWIISSRHEKSPKVWTACRDREPFGCSAQLVSFSAWIISPPHAKRWQSKCQWLKYLPCEKKKGAAKCSWDDGGGAPSPFSLKRQRSSTILSVASQDTLTHLKR